MRKGITIKEAYGKQTRALHNNPKTVVNQKRNCIFAPLLGDDNIMSNLLIKET
jgi:hypothetical protein